MPYFAAPVEVENDQGWTNYLRLADLDGDGDLDLVVPSCASFFEAPVGDEPFRIYDNDGGVFSESTAARLGSAPSLAVRVVAVGDIDGDGDLDLYLPSADGALDRLYINDGSGVFTDEAAARLPTTANASRSAAARFGDVDGDGDLDLLVAQGYVAPDSPPAWLLLNEGGVFTDATARLPQTFAGTDPDDIDFADIDRDFDLDVLINAHEGASALWQNDGSGSFTDISGNMPGPAGGPYHYGPSVCDVDDDGDLDIVVDNIGAAPQREQLLINDGSGSFSDGTSQLGDNATADDNGVMCADVDDDGDFDLVIPSLSGNERILINTAGTFALEPSGFPSVADPTLWMDFGDLDGDGRIDAVTGQGESGAPSNHVSRVYFGSGAMPVDTTPPNIIAFETPDDTSAEFTLRFAVSDRIVTDSGPRVRAFAREIGARGEVELDAAFMGGDLFAVSLSPGNYSVALCAVDAQGNETCTEAMPVGTSTSGPSGAGGGGANGNAASSTGSGGASGDEGFGVEESGCGCHLSAPTPLRHAWWLAGIGLMLWHRRRSG